MATLRKKRVPAASGPELSTQGTPSVDEDVVVGLIPALQEIVAWWQDRKATLEHASDTTQETERVTFHVERRWIEAIRRQADLDHLTITHVVNAAFRQYFERG